MKQAIFLSLFLFFLHGLRAQKARVDSSLTGEYRTQGADFTFEISLSKGRLQLQVVGQGTTELAPVSGLVFEPLHIRPVARIEFLKDSLGHIDRLRWSQRAEGLKWTRISSPSTGYTGDYQLAINPYRVLHITEAGGVLRSHLGEEPDSVLTPVTKDRFVIKMKGGDYHFDFKREKGDVIGELMTDGKDEIVFEKVSSSVPRHSNRTNGFTRADTLQGRLTSLRTCYDVLFYDLALTVLPEIKTIRGSNTIRFRVVHALDRLQIDLHANLHIETIRYHGRELAFMREQNAVYVAFPVTLKEGQVDSLTVVYDGKPLEPDMSALRGGIFWVWNRNHELWIESVTQGVGANVFWPCKDHLSDRPDSMRMSITIPSGLTEISNGRLLQKTDLPGGQTRWVWYVDYPIVTYAVVINIGDYAHFTDTYTGRGGPLALNFYTQSYNADFGKRLFADVKRMLALYEKDFGPYPFRRDGFTLLESIYPMEHQGAVGVGSFNSPFNSERIDTNGLVHTMWHESAHEWWGNSVGCRDYADMWIHESFADYAEFLNEEALHGRQAALQQLTKDHPENKEPIIGIYDVNNFHMGDMYLKGSLLLETLRDVIDNDSLWFSIFRGIQERFRYQPVRTEDIVDYVNTASGKDYTYFFDQYLRYPHIPVLALAFKTEGDKLLVSYKWEADVPGFRMPVKVTTGKDSMAFIQPTTEWKTMSIKGMTQNEFRVDTTGFYVGTRIETILTGH